MLVVCAKTGLTYGSRVWHEGDIFSIIGALEEEYRHLSETQWLRKQKQMYRSLLFRKPTEEEVIAAYKEKKISKEQMNPREVRWVANYDKAQGELRVKRGEALNRLADEMDKKKEFSVASATKPSEDSGVTPGEAKGKSSNKPKK